MKFISECAVELIKTDFDDTIPVIAARTSTAGIEARQSENVGLINSLMRNRHGVPFEHMTMTVRITAPIFTWEQIVKHRISSLSRESGRYKVLGESFYIPSIKRPITQTGKAMEYNIQPGSFEQLELVSEEVKKVCEFAYAAYQNMLKEGIAKEVARMILPVNTMSVGVMTFNARSLMNFLNLRITGPLSHPQWEIETIAQKIEAMFEHFAPVTYAAFVDNGRICP